MKLRKKYIDNGLLDPSMLATNTNALLYQVPGGMLSNLLTAETGWRRSALMMFWQFQGSYDAGYPPLVTPTSDRCTQVAFQRNQRARDTRQLLRSSRDLLRASTVRHQLLSTLSSRRRFLATKSLSLAVLLTFFSQSLKQ